jgi:ribose transport system ATP-binding protein
LVSDRSERKLTGKWSESLGIRLASAQQLSGGNQQKVSLAKWLAADCDILIVDEPTVGIDVRTKAAFHQLIAELAAGRALLLISSDLPETVALADRIAVMSELKIVGELVNNHDYQRMSQQIIRMIHAETHVEAA